jgi:hypothetical protein
MKCVGYNTSFTNKRIGEHGIFFRYLEMKHYPFLNTTSPLTLSWNLIKRLIINPNPLGCGLVQVHQLLAHAILSSTIVNYK